MKKISILIASLILAATAWAQQATTDILSVMDLRVDSSSVSYQDGIIYMSVTEVKTLKERQGVEVFSPDSLYEEAFSTQMQQIMHQSITDFEQMAAYSTGDSIPDFQQMAMDNLKQKMGLNNFLMESTFSLIKKGIEPISFVVNLSFDCKGKVYYYQSISFQTRDGQTQVVEAPKDNREVLFIDSRSSIKKIFDKYCNH